jgi:hypothetical protein
MDIRKTGSKNNFYDIVDSDIMYDYNDNGVLKPITDKNESDRIDKILCYQTQP